MKRKWSQPMATVSRRRALQFGVGLPVVASQMSATPMSAKIETDEISRRVDEIVKEQKLRSVLLTVLDHGEPVLTNAWGESLPGMAASPDMHIRNGAVAITYVAVALLTMSDDGLLDIDAPISNWLPDFPDATEATPRMLAQMTAGYPDYVQAPTFADALFADPFRF